jgi:hypothetical protein
MIMVIGRSGNFCALACELKESTAALTAPSSFIRMTFRIR